MRHPVTNHAPLAFPALGLTALALLGGCNTAASPEQTTNEPGSSLQDPDTGRYFFVDPSYGGLSAEVRITRMAYGRLVDVYGLDSQGKRVLMNQDFAIAPSLVSDGSSYLLENSPVTAQQTLTILHDVTDETPGGGLEQYLFKLLQAEQNVEPVFDKGLAGSGFFSMVPRNAVAILFFDDLIDASTLDSTTVKSVVGTPSTIPFEARLLIDRNHGDLAEHDGQSGAEFYSSRVLVDMTVSEPESFKTDPPLPVNSLGLPASVDSSLSNVQLRIPTKLDPLLGQDKILMNPSGHGLATAGNGSVDYSSPFLDVARAFRSGGPTEVTLDPYNGFLPDSDAPRVVGVQNGNLTAIADDPSDTDPAVFRVTYEFDSDFCSQSPVPGDTLSQPGIYAEVVEPASVNNKVVTNLKVRLTAYPSDWPNGPTTWLTTGSGPTQYLAPFHPVEDGARAACFVTITPPGPNPEQPTTNIQSTATARLLFNEPMDPGRVNAFDAITITRELEPAGSYDYIVGDIGSSIDLHKFYFLPDQPFAHQNGQNEDYYLKVVPGNPSVDILAGPVDLAGNELADTLPPVQLILDSVTFESQNGGRASLFTSSDEEPPFAPDGEPLVNGEWAGQHIFDLTRGVIEPRPVVHFQGIVDRNNNDIVGAMTATAVGMQAPLSKFGSKAQIMWRYMDMGLDLYTMVEPFDDADTTWDIDPTDFNIDVEGLSWAPFGGDVVVDSFTRFEIALSHSRFFPDESGLASSGIVPIFENNLLSATADPQRVVHDRYEGYTINPGDIYLANNNLRLLPFPLNHQVDPEDYKYYTFRDTSIRTRGGADISGVPPLHYYNVTGKRPPTLPDPNDNCALDVAVFNPFYAAEEVQTIGLPLLIEFRCWQDDGAGTINRLDSSASGGPFFRGHSTGGINEGLQTVFIDPDLENMANGGFDTTSQPPGAPTPGNDFEVYIGAADFVTRISRTHSIWFLAVDPSNPSGPISNASYNPPVIQPSPLDQPIGTSVDFSFRGASSVTNANAAPKEDAASLDLYGDHYIEGGSPCDGSYNHNDTADKNSGVSFDPNTEEWFDNVTSINGAEFYQVRITWTSNPLTGLRPELTAFGMTWAAQ